MKIGVVGFGYWGPNIVRNFSKTPGVKVTHICDNGNAIAKAQSNYPEIECVKDYRDVTNSTEIDAVAIVTPVFTHFEIAKAALENGKHIFIEKPFTSTSAQAEELINLAEQKKLIIMVDHTFLFTGAVKKIKELVQKEELGKMYYYDSTRVNLGLFQHDINVIWDLAPHDFSIVNYITESQPLSLAAHGFDHFGRKLENIAYITAYYKDDFIAHFTNNWLSPVKLRSTLIGGEKKMLVWDDLQADEKIKIYDKGVDIQDQDKEGMYNLLVGYRSGDMYCPKIENLEALKIEADYFIDCVHSSKTPINDGKSGLQIVKMLEACDQSLKQNGKIINL